MMLQSQDGIVHLLPALPDAWKNGKVTGLRARNGFQVDMTWRDGRLVSATIHSDLGEPCSVNYGGKAVAVEIAKGQSITLDGNLKLN
jgi:alpha-L-fucosidase 2